MTAFWVAALFLVTGAIFLLPLLPAIVELKRRQDIAPLKIEQGYEGNAQYFAESFRRFILGAITRDDTRQEFMILEANDSAAWSVCASSGNIVPRVVVSEADLKVPDGLNFERELYGGSDIAGGQGNRYRAVLAEGDLRLGKDSTVLRWAHANRVRVDAGNALFGRITAMDSIEVHSPARFTRLNAPVIRFGAICGDWAHTIRSPAEFSRRVIHGDYRAQPGEHVGDSVVANGFASVSSDAMMMGSVKGGTGVRVDPGAAIHGSLISGQDAEIIGSCYIAGPVIVEGELLIGRDAVIGSSANPTTVTANVIRVQVGACVHGSVWAKERGWVEA